MFGKLRRNIVKLFTRDRSKPKSVIRKAINRFKGTRIQIIKCSDSNLWYNKKIGEKFVVLNPKLYKNVYFTDNGYMIKKVDTKVLSQ